jgi:hypothetical protein
MSPGEPPVNVSVVGPTVLFIRLEGETYVRARRDEALIVEVGSVVGLCVSSLLSWSLRLVTELDSLKEFDNEFVGFVIDTVFFVLVRVPVGSCVLERVGVPEFFVRVPVYAQ